MPFFIYAELPNELPYSYQKPLLTKIKRHFPDVIYLDMDAHSEEFLVSQACRLVAQAEVGVIYFNSSAPETSLGATLPLAEVLIRRQEKTLVILQGPHSRLERLLINRSNLTFLNNPSEELLLEHLRDFYG